MRRNAETHLNDWFRKKDRMPLILRGARQVGKSTLVRLFCKSHKLDLIEINLEKEKIRSAGRENFELNTLLDEIQLKSRKKITTKTLVFFDEIQEQPKLIELLRYFYEERPDIAVCAAGSLLEIGLRDDDFSFPVGRVEFYHLGPMSFTEFLEATGQDQLKDKILKLELNDAVSEVAKESLRQFLYVGGMPKAVQTFVSERSLVNVRDIQDQLVQTYFSDFPKYNSKINYQRINRIFISSVSQIGKKVIYQRFDRESQSRDVKRVLELLTDARILYPCFHSDANSVPLSAERDYTIQKLYFLDVGLMNSILKVDLETIDSELTNHFSSKGLMAEQFVAQHLANIHGNKNPPELNYWLRDKGIQKGEIDFLLEKGQKIVPVEVKSTGAGHLKSAFYFAKEKHCKILIRASMLDFEREKIRHKIGEEIVFSEMINLPLYAIEAALQALP